jgi:two-component system nitrate/nitrite response regulator NarL
VAGGTGGMGLQIATIIVEPRLLVREALESLMASHSYRVVCGIGSTADIGSPLIVGDGPKLVILGAQSFDSAVTEAVGIRKLWPDSKIILLFEFAAPDDLQKLLTSEIDACVPLFASPDTLVSTLDLIVIRDVRVMVVSNTKRLPIHTVQADELHQPEIRMGSDHPCGPEPETISITMVGMQPTQPATNGNGAADAKANGNGTEYVAPLRNLPQLSEREAQILDGLVKGQANKVIARMCGMTEATVKVHMKSIMRKIRVSNRTQAAIWALEHGYSVAELRAAY